MREIKFRAWDGDTMRDFTNPKNGIEYCCGELTVSSGWDSSACPTYGDTVAGPLLVWEIMQYTGLKDKNGVEIFEGDIVRILYTDWPSQPMEQNGRHSLSLEEYKDSISNVGKIVFIDCKFCVQFNHDGYTGSIFPGTHGQIKVIGNIHENPELRGK